MSEKQRLLEFDDRDCAMPDRLTRAALRVGSIKRGAVEGSEHTLRADQIGVYTDFADFLSDAAHSPESFRDVMPTGRIVLPPRTGKTVLAGQIIAGAGMMTTFIVPTLTLVRQTARDLAKQLPDIPIGTYCGESKDLVMWGINVTTYQILQKDLASKHRVPIPIELSSLVFADEGHHAMTADRQKVLTKAFDLRAVRVALTATPNYDVERRLAKYFERLIHEITISEAVELEMVAPLRIWIAEVDVDASRVSMKAGEFEEVELGRVMGAAPFFEATRVFRYSAINRKKRALICCVTRQQAHDLQEYLQAKRPKGTSVPTVIVGETKERERILSEFQAGTIDTLINVGVLIEGWNAGPCKLLIDLAPSYSWVRATQKFFRPMTRWKNKEAFIYQLIPSGLPEFPVCPMDLFEWDLPEYRQGELIASSRKRASQQPPPIQTSFDVIKKVKLRSSIVFSARFEKPKLDPKNLRDIRKVLLSNSAVTETKIPGYMPFRNLLFIHPLFKGRGQNLLRYCGIRPDRFTYINFIAQFFPEAVSDLYLGDRNYCGTDFRIDDKSCEEDLAYMNAQLVEGREHELDEDFEHGWMAIGGHLQDETEVFFDLEEDYVRTVRLSDVLKRLLATLTAREEKVLRMSFGIEMDEYMDVEIAEEISVSKTRIYQMVKKALRCLRHPSRKRDLEQFRYLLW